MATFKVPGVQGHSDNLLDHDNTGGSGFRLDWYRVPTGSHVPGPVALSLAPQGASSPAKQAQAAVTKPTALIIIGAGQDEIRKGVRYRKNRHFKEAALSSFKKFTKSHATKLVFVKSAPEMVKLIKSQPWDVVVYFGHGYLLSRTLVPGYGENSDESGLSEDQLTQSLRTSKAKDVYIFGCRAGWTGLARSVSKSLPGVTIRATFNDLDVDWIQSGIKKGRKTTLNQNEFIMKEELTEYKNGFEMKSGIKAKKRKAEHSDPIRVDGDPLGENLIDQ